MHPHPLLHDVLVRIQTNEKSNPLDSLSSAIEDLSTECEELTQRFKVICIIIALSNNVIHPNIDTIRCI